MAGGALMRRLLRGVDVDALLDEFAASVERELDLRVEGRVADRFAFDFRPDPKIVVPRIVWTRTAVRVLTMERMYGWRLSELDEAELAGVDAHGLAVHGATAFMRQVMLYGRYHADLHPSNLFVTPDNRIAYLDFGIVGHLTDAERGDIAQVLAGFVYRDADRALRYSANLGRGRAAGQGGDGPPRARRAARQDDGRRQHRLPPLRLRLPGAAAPQRDRDPRAATGCS